MKHPKNKNRLSWSNRLVAALAEAHQYDHSNKSAPIKVKAIAKQPKPSVKMARIIHQTNSHEEIHLVSESVAKDVRAEYAKPSAVVFTYTTKNKARSYFKGLSKLTQDQRVELAKENLLQY